VLGSPATLCERLMETHVRVDQLKQARPQVANQRTGAQLLLIPLPLPSPACGRLSTTTVSFASFIPNGLLAAMINRD
jgi:hypothetical protein